MADDATIKRVARAIYEAELGKRTDERWAEVWASYTDPYAVSKGGTWEVLRAALAAIKAHTAALAEAGLVIVPREPTEAMSDAADNIDPGYGDGCLPGRLHWPAMIAAAPR